MSADSELENLRSDLAHVDALATLRADLAEVDANLKRLDDPGLGPPSAVLFYRRYYQREREKIMLRIDLLELPRKIETCKRNYKMESSPGERLRHKKHCQMIQQSRALGRSKETSLPPYPEEAARRSLTEVRGQFRTAELRLQELTTGDAEWAEQLRTTAPPERLATEDTAPAPLLRSSNATRTPAAPEKRNIGQPTTLDKSTAIEQLASTGGVVNGNRARVDAFIARMDESGRKITRKDISAVAGYASRTELQRFQTGNRCTASAKHSFNRVLSMTPEDFASALRKRSSPK